MEAKDQKPHATEMFSSKEAWVKPELVVKPKNEIENDPTINDDGLSHGLFS